MKLNNFLKLVTFIFFMSSYSFAKTSLENNKKLKHKISTYKKSLQKPSHVQSKTALHQSHSTVSKKNSSAYSARVAKAKLLNLKRSSHILKKIDHSHFAKSVNKKKSNKIARVSKIKHKKKSRMASDKEKSE